VVDEFNGFLFQHTSRISLDDIVAAQKKKEEEKKIQSPYTKEYKEKVNLWPFVYAIISIILFTGILYLIISHINKAPGRTDELKNREEIIYELA